MDTIQVEERDTNLSSKELRNAREKNRLPAAIYGKEVPSKAVFLNAAGGKIKDIKNGKHFSVKLDGQTLQATVEEVQKDPVSSKLLHVSLHAVSAEEVMKTDVPIVIVGEAIGHKRNGVVTQTKNTVTLKGKFEDLPEQIELDVTSLDVNEHWEVKDIPLPDRVELAEEKLTQNVVVCSYSNVSLEEAAEVEPTEETATKTDSMLKKPEGAKPPQAQA